MEDKFELIQGSRETKINTIKKKPAMVIEIEIKYYNEYNVQSDF